MLHSFERIFIHQFLELSLASEDRGAGKSQLFRQSGLDAFLEFLHTSGWAIEDHIPAGNDGLDVLESQALENAPQLIVSHVGVHRGNAA